MKKRNFSIGLLFIIIFLTCAVLFLKGNYVVYLISYVFSFAFLFCYTIFSSSGVGVKAARIIVYALIMTAQILFAVLVIRPSGDDELCRLLGAFFLLTPFLVKQIF